MEIQFIHACEKGDLELAQQLFYNNNINISTNNEEAFRYACYHGHLQVAQGLLYVKPNINISADNEQTFRDVCYFGHLQVAQWLLSVKPDINISAKDDYAFHWACYYGHLQVAQWLQTLKPYLYIINYNKDGTYKSYHIRTKEEEQRLKQRIHALWLASDTTPNKNNILHQLPQDISRLIISYI